MIEELKKNVDIEIEMLREISNYLSNVKDSPETEARLLEGAIQSLRKSMKLINGSIPSLLKEISPANKLPSMEKQKSTAPLEHVTFKRTGKEISVVLHARDREKFFRELSINEQFVKKLRRKERSDKEEIQEFKASRGYLKWANKFFLDTASSYTNKGYFHELREGLRRANVDILFESYVAMMFFSTFLAIIGSIFITLLLLVFDTIPIWPFLELRSSDYLARVGDIFWIPLVIPIAIFFLIYYYPSTEKKSIGSRIDQELPFAVIHMSAISGSGIEPSELFRIIGLSREYPYLRKEIRKVLNQINLYGYDLTTALNNAVKTAPSENLSELFSGLSATITSGANLKEFFEKRAETLLLGYRLEREKYTHLVETFLDIYISIVIAAPMIFLLLLVMMAISGISVGLSPFQLSLLAVFTISLLNVIFLVFLHIKQPSY